MTSHRTLLLTVSAFFAAGVLGLLVLLFILRGMPSTPNVRPGSPPQQAETGPANPPVPAGQAEAGSANTPAPAEESGVTCVYRSDFTAPPGVEWSHPKIGRTPKDQRPYLGRFVEQPVTLNLTTLPPHKLLRITFDLYLMGSWDGSSKRFGEKIWDLNLLDGRSLLHTTFGNCGFFTDNNEQAFPDSYPCRPHPAWTGSVEHGTLGTTQSWGPGRTWDVSSVYHFELTFPHAEPDAAFEFKATMRGGKDKSYGLANVQVDVLPELAMRTDAELAALWRDLGDADPARFFKAQWDLVAACDPAVDFIARHLDENIDLPTPRLDALIRELASADDVQAKPLQDRLVCQGRAAQAGIASALDDDTIPAAGKPRLTSVERTIATYPETATELRLHRARQLLLAIHTPAAQALATKISADHFQPESTGARLPMEAFTAGGEGDWHKAFVLYQDWVASGNSTISGWAYAVAAALAANETNACLKLCRQFINRYGYKDDRSAAERCAKACLTVPWTSGEVRERALACADLAATSSADNRWRQLAKGMAEYRRGNWSNALEWLSQPERSSNLEASTLAWAFGAMARRQSGDAASAKECLEEVNRRLAVVVETGELSGPTFENYALAFSVRKEAAQLILGREIPATVPPNVVAEGRQRWQLIRPLIIAGDELAARQQWAKAAEIFAQALHAPGFTWDLWELKQRVPSVWLPAAALLAGNEARHLELCRELLERTNARLAVVVRLGYAGVCLARTRHLPADLRERAIVTARQACQSSEESAGDSALVLRGTLACRQNQFNEALASLEAAESIQNPITRARALAFRGIASIGLGRVEAARQALEDAEQDFASGSGSNSEWWGVGLTQVAIDELRTLLATSNKPQGL